MSGRTDPTVRALRDVAGVATRHQIWCPSCTGRGCPSGDVYLDGPHQDGRYLCACCGRRFHDLRALVRRCAPGCRGCA